MERIEQRWSVVVLYEQIVECLHLPTLDCTVTCSEVDERGVHVRVTTL